MAPFITINTHTTASSPRPHILYTVQVTLNGRHSTVDKRYSEVFEFVIFQRQKADMIFLKFAALHGAVYSQPSSAHM